MVAYFFHQRSWWKKYENSQAGMDGCRTHRGPQRDPPPVLKTGKPTGTYPLPEKSYSQCIGLSNSVESILNQAKPFSIITFFLKIATGLVFFSLSLYTTTDYILTGRIRNF